LGENLTRKACKREKVLNKIENTEKIMKIREKMKKKLGENLTRKACKREKVSTELKIQRNS